VGQEQFDEVPFHRILTTKIIHCSISIIIKVCYVVNYLRRLFCCLIRYDQLGDFQVESITSLREVVILVSTP
jgi:hypothetical protein